MDERVIILLFYIINNNNLNIFYATYNGKDRNKIN